MELNIQIKDTMAIFEEHHYKLNSKIGVGGYSSVYLVFSERYQQYFAVKIIPITHCKNTISVDQEVQSLIGLNHPNIIKMYEHFKDDKNLYIVFDYCPNGSLMDEIERNGKIPEPLLMNIFREICTALRHCHSRNIAHHDIKPANILIDRYGRSVLADFNLSQIGNMSRNYMGSRVFMAPEQVKMESYDPKKADIWALGVTLYMMLTGDVPWPLTSLEDLDDAIVSGSVSFAPEIPEELVKLLTAMLNIDSSERPTIDQILRMDIFPHQVLKHGSNRVCKQCIESPVSDPRFCKTPETPKQYGKAFVSPLASRRVFDGRRRRSSTMICTLTVPKVANNIKSVIAD